MTTTLIREKLHNYITIAGDKKLKAIYAILENEITETKDWWKDDLFIKELDKRLLALETGKDKGVSVTQLQTSISKLRRKKYGK